MDSVSFAKHRTLFGKVVLVDGVGHSGKLLLGPLLSTYERVELTCYETVFDHVAVLYHYKKITLDAAITLLRERLDELLYNLMIGRNVNFRPSDNSSAFGGGKADVYIKRLLSPDGDDVVKLMLSEPPICQIQTHELLGFIEPFLAAFGTSLYVVEMLRHPADVVASWLKRGWGGSRFTDDPRSFILSFDYNGKQLPYYAYSFRERYDAMGELERVIHCIYSCMRKIWDTYHNLSDEHKSQVVFSKFDMLAMQTTDELERLASFLRIEKGPSLERVLKEQNCPREIDLNEREKNVSEMLRASSKASQEMLLEMIADYEKGVV